MHDEIELGFAAVPLPGEEVSGDSYIVKPIPDGILLAVVDGLGHGPEAAAASKIAITILDTYALEPVVRLVGRCHEALRKTRGVVMSIAKLNPHDRTMTWLGVGNIEGLVLRGKTSRERLLLRGGALGYLLPTPRESVILFTHGDTLIFVTDGIRSNFDGGIKLDDRPQQIADTIMSQFNKRTDDALVLVVRYTCK